MNLIQNAPSDNKLLECAQEGEVDYIVSGDQHLLDLKEFKGIEIVQGEELLEILNSELRGGPSSFYLLSFNGHLLTSAVVFDDFLLEGTGYSGRGGVGRKA